MPTCVQIEKVSVSYGTVQALNDVSFQCAAGERVALIGANGCGKSTLLRAVHGLLPTAKGQVRVLPQLHQAMLFQRPHFLRTTVLHNVALALWMDRKRGFSWRQAREQAMAVLDQLGMSSVAGQGGRSLSVGQLQRVALARAWALQPQLLLLDEPTASLDPQGKREVEAMIQTFAHEQPEVSLLFASHNLGQVKRLASRVMYLEQGRLLADLPVADFFDSERLQVISPQAQAFVRGELP